jgi:hypothetical protein
VGLSQSIFGFIIRELVVEGPNDALRELFDRELDALVTQASGLDAAALSTRIKRLNGLAKLIETRDAAKPMTGPIDPSSLGAGLREVQLPQTGLIATSPVSFTTAVSKHEHGVVSLPPLLPPAGADVKLAYSEVPNQYLIAVEIASPALEAARYGPVIIAVVGSPDRNLDFVSPTSISLHSSPNNIGLDLTFPALPQSPLSPQFYVRPIGFSRVDQSLRSNQTVLKCLFTILPGTLTFEWLNGREVHLRPGEELHFQQPEGEVRSVDCGAKHIDVKFQGRVRGMTTGTGEGVHSVMPTYLEWLRARHGLTLLWGLGVDLFGLAAAALLCFWVKI